MRLNNKTGFSLIELLTVIAIIGILAAIIFPAMSAARANARKTSCTTNLSQIQTALKLYKQDNNSYPPILAAYANPGVPFDNITKHQYLFREYVKGNNKLFSCPDSLNTDLSATVPDPLAGQSLIGLNRPANLANGDPAQLYVYDSYDVQVIANVTQPRYTLSWANTAADVQSISNMTPDEASLAFERQLKFRNPPDDTVITWCSYHRGGDRSPQRSGAIDLVLFLDGHVDRIPSNQVQPAGSVWNYTYTIKPVP